MGRDWDGAGLRACPIVPLFTAPVSTRSNAPRLLAPMSSSSPAEREMLKGVTLKRKLCNYGRRLVTLLPAWPIQLWWFHHPDISAWIVLPLMLAAMYALDFALSRLGWRDQPTPLHQEPPPEITRYTNPRYSKS
jgi:hypothetical protein